VISYHNDPVQPITIKKLSDLISLETLKLIETGISADLEESVTIIESDCTRIDRLKLFEGKEINISCSDYCTEIRAKNTYGDDLCKNFDNKKLLEVIENNTLEPFWYFCWAGLVDFISPIIINNLIIGIVISGQIVLDDEIGIKNLENGITEVNNKLGISIELLVSKSKQTKRVSEQNLKEVYIPKLRRVAKIITEIAEKSYNIQRKLNEDLFLEEISSYLDYSNKGLRNIDAIDIVINRLAEFYKFERVYFLYSRKKINEPVKLIASKGTNLSIDELKDRNIFTKLIKPSAFASVSIFKISLTTHEELFDNLASFIEDPSKKHIYIGTCPLIAEHLGIFVFENPIKCSGFRKSDILNELENDFLRRFCSTVKDKLNNSLSFGLVLNRIGHELGNSVQALISNEDAVIDSYLDPNEVMQIVKNNIKELYKHSYYISNLKSSLSKSNRKTYIFKKNSLRNLVDKIVETLEGDAKGKYINIKPDFRGNDIILMCIEELQRALFNIIQNAIKYSFSNKFIQIIGIEDKENKCYSMKVMNYGVGITEEELKLGLIFNEGYRGLLSVDRNRTGSGLGLSVAKEIIENHNGEICVNSISAKKLALIKNGEFIEDIDDIIEEDIEREILINGIQKVGYLTIFIIKLPFYQKDV
jgi:signal transduction histidine kinase/ligand-binding sensor protein